MLNHFSLEIFQPEQKKKTRKETVQAHELQCAQSKIYTQTNTVRARVRWLLIRNAWGRFDLAPAHARPYVLSFAVYLYFRISYQAWICKTKFLWITYMCCARSIYLWPSPPTTVLALLCPFGLNQKSVCYWHWTGREIPNALWVKRKTKENIIRLSRYSVAFDEFLFTPFDPVRLRKQAHMTVHHRRRFDIAIVNWR